MFTRSWCAPLSLLLAAGAALLTVPSFVTPARGQCELRWRKIADGALPSRSGWAFATDPATGEVYAAEPDVTGQNLNGRLWRSTPTGWRNVGQGNVDVWPNSAVVFDADRGRLLTVQPQENNGPSMEVWEWGGSTWTYVPNAPDAPAPQSRTDASIVYDSVRGVTLLFGGRGGSSYPNDLWAWDGERWTMLDPGGSGGDRPNGSISPPMAFDPVRGVLVLFGSLLRTSEQGTWEWDGQEWRLAASGPITPLHRGHLTFDPSRGKVVHYGPGPTFNEWVLREWDGAAWTRFTEQVGPPGHDASFFISPHDGRLTMIRDWSETAAAFDGEAWVESSHGGPPPRRTRAVFDDARGVMVLTGGEVLGSDHQFQAVWEFDGTAWSLRPGSNLSGLAGMLPVSFPLRGVVYALGRATGPGQLMGAFAWDGEAWESVPAEPGDPRPPLRDSGAVAYDSDRGVAVLFGGQSGVGVAVRLDDTWEFDGQTWTRITPLAAPSPRFGHAMAYDAANQRTLLYGGGDPTPPYSSELWAYDGQSQTWTMLPSQPGPPGLLHARMVYDPHRGVALLFGGLTQPTLATSGLWQWDGSAWTFLNIRGPRPSSRAAAAFVYDPERRAAILYGGSTFRLSRFSFPLTGGFHPDLGDTWILHRAADHDIDGSIDSRDVAAFLGSWVRSVGDGSPEGDFDADGAATSADISAFLEQWLAAVQGGC